MPSDQDRLTGEHEILIEEQRQRCLSGQHETGALLNESLSFNGAEYQQLKGQFVRWCRFCRCLFV